MYHGGAAALFPVRSHGAVAPKKEIEMKARMLMLAVGAALTVAVPVANARHVTNHRAVAGHKVVTSTKTGKTGKVGKTLKGVPPRPPLYIYVPGFTGAPSVAPDTDWCTDYAVDCSDQ
jgi:hypothetical protein